MDSLIRAYLPLVRAIAQGFRTSLPPHIDVEDLVQEGSLALRSIAEGFDPDRGVSFAVYAWPRVRGAMLDYIRRCYRETWPSTNAGAELQNSDEGSSAAAVENHLVCELLTDLLDSREKAIIRGEFLEGHSLAALARQMHVSDTRVRQIRNRALRRMRDKAAA